jgi:hypothetical protein
VKPANDDKLLKDVCLEAGYGSNPTPEQLDWAKTLVMTVLQEFDAPAIGAKGAVDWYQDVMKDVMASIP